MNAIITAINHFAQRSPEAIAVEGEHIHLSYGALHNEIETLSRYLKSLNIRCLALWMDNSPAWVVFDLAAQKAGITLVPIPPFFSPQQLQHSLKDAGAEIVITDQTKHVSEILPEYKLRPMPKVAGQSCWQTRLAVTTPKQNLAGIAKVTYTSGTTGKPKGVCLYQSVMDNVAVSLSQTLAVTAEDRHLCLLPLSVLLENIGGVYTALRAGACCIIPGLERTGTAGAARLNVQNMAETINSTRASTIILLPQMLQALVSTLQTARTKPGQLRIAAVGGAPLSTQLLVEARGLGLPVFEGYGLSECASVVAVNTPAHHRTGSVGQVLPHIQIRFSEEGEILLKGNLFKGYLNHERQINDWYASGDLGYLDNDGYLYITGRKKSCFITSFGRNVAPEWMEKELTIQPAIAQAAVFGEARPYNIAVITAQADDKHVTAAIEAANCNLPDYARISAWLPTDEAFSSANSQLTANGRPRREAIWATYGERINQLYRERKSHVVFQ